MVVKHGFYHAKCTTETTDCDLPFIFFVYFFILHFIFFKIRVQLSLSDCMCSIESITFAKDKSVSKEPS